MTPQDATDDTIRDMLIAARRAAGRWSQKRLADEVGVTERTVKRWEKEGGPEDAPDEENEAALVQLLPLDADAFAEALAEARPPAALSRDALERLQAVEDAVAELRAVVDRLREERGDAREAP